jgi:anthranilate 1,2-dioxygenase small subunit
MYAQEKKFLVEELQNNYVATIDDDRLESWPDFFVDACVYKIIPRENADANLPVAVMFCDSKGMMRDRIVALRKANIYAPHFYRHLISNLRIVGEENGVLLVETNYVVFQTLLDGETKIYQAGKYQDKIVEQDGKLKFKEKICVFDTYRIPTLLVTPI